MNVKLLDGFMDGLCDAGIPSGELMIKLDGETVYHRCVGYNDDEKTVPCSENDLYWLFSSTKVVTCIAAMQLLEEGKIALDDPVSKYLPAYEHLKVRSRDGTVTDAKNALLVKHLFTMTGGLSYDFRTENVKSASERSTLGLVNAMAKDPLLFEPGTHFLYSLCHDVLGAVIEVAGGMRLRDYMKKRLFDPLEIEDMGFHPSAEQAKRIAPMYVYKNGAGISVRKPDNTNVFRLSPDYDSGGAGLFGSCRDYSKIITALSLGGTAKNGYRVLKDETLRMLRVNMLDGDPLEDYSVVKRYGYGWGLCCRVHINPALSLGKSPIGEFGWDSAGGAYSLIDPDNRLSVFYLQHIMDCLYSYDKLHPYLRDTVYKAVLGI
ncbi:MAG: beta-lactamase family protein [Clostridia bacterium]|nr:beta-lactamase family protein [Clostridia bacterium]